jgi:hypothetical protein
MEKTYVIQWKNKTDALPRLGKKLLSREEAELLAEELNAEFPDLSHQAFKIKAENAPAAETSANPPPDDGNFVEVGFTEAVAA